MKQIKGPLYLAAAFMLAGTSVISARYVTGRLDTFTIAAVSLFFAVCGLTPLCLRKLPAVIRSLRFPDFMSLLLQAVFGIFLFRMFLLFGLLNTSTGEAGILTGATPAATAVLAALMLRERLYGMKMAGIFCTVAGIVLIQGFAFFGGFEGEHFKGNIFVLCAAVCESFFNVLSRRNVVRDADKKTLEIDAAVRTWIVSFMAFILCFAAALPENPLPDLAALNIFQWLSLLWYGLVVTALAFIFWYAGIKRCEASTAAVFSGMMPFTSLMLSVLLLGEKPSLLQLAGGFLIIGGMLLSGKR